MPLARMSLIRAAIASRVNVFTAGLTHTESAMDAESKIESKKSTDRRALQETADDSIRLLSMQEDKK